MTELTGLEVVREFNTKMAAMREEMLRAGKEAFGNVSKAIFDKYPELQSYSWTQYTPYFNDGEDCVFGVNEYWDVRTVGQAPTSTTFDDYDELSYMSPDFYANYPKYRPKPEWKAELAADLHELFDVVGEDTFKDMFGDHVRVTVDRDKGVETDDYEHE